MQDKITREVAEQLRKKLAVVDAEGRVVLQVALIVTVYIADSHRHEVRENVTACCEHYARRWGPQLKWALNPQTDLMEPYGVGLGSAPRTWLPTLGEDEPFTILWHGAQDDRGAGEFSLESQGVERRPYTEFGFFRVSFPLIWIVEEQEPLTSIMLDICNRLKPVSGYAGIGIIESPDNAISSEYEPTVFQWAQRFPGLEVDYPISHSIWLAEGREGGRDGIKGAGWLTVIGDRYIGEMGGASRMRADLVAIDGEIVVHSYGGGLLVQAGRFPQLGNAERNQWPTMYGKLARYLRPIRVTHHNPFQHGGPGERFDHERSEAWLRRLDDR